MAALRMPLQYLRLIPITVRRWYRLTSFDVNRCGLGGPFTDYSRVGDTRDLFVVGSGSAETSKIW